MQESELGVILALVGIGTSAASVLAAKNRWVLWVVAVVSYGVAGALLSRAYLPKTPGPMLAPDEVSVIAFLGVGGVAAGLFLSCRKPVERTLERFEKKKVSDYESIWQYLQDRSNCMTIRMLFYSLGCSSVAFLFLGLSIAAVRFALCEP